jgi:hypothetical protein
MEQGIMTDRKQQPKPNKATGKPTELDEATLDGAAGGTKHPAKVTVPDVKISVGY